MKNKTKEQWAKELMTNGLVVVIDKSRWSGSTKVKLHELGISFSNKEVGNFVKKHIGSMPERLLPLELLSELKKIDSYSKLQLEKYSYDTEWGRFVPYSSFNKWYNINNNAKKTFIEASNTIFQRYDEIVIAVKNNYQHLAIDVWRRLYPNDTGRVPPHFIEEFTNNIIKKNTIY